MGAMVCAHPVSANHVGPHFGRGCLRGMSSSAWTTSASPLLRQRVGADLVFVGGCVLSSYATLISFASVCACVSVALGVQALLVLPQWYA